MEHLDEAMKLAGMPKEYLPFEKAVNAWGEDQRSTAAAGFRFKHGKMFFGYEGALFDQNVRGPTRVKVQALLDNGFSALNMLQVIIALYPADCKLSPRRVEGLLVVLDMLLPACKDAKLLEEALSLPASREVLDKITQRVHNIRHPKPLDLDSDGEEGENLDETASVDEQEGLEVCSTLWTVQAGLCTGW